MTRSWTKNWLVYVPDDTSSDDRFYQKFSNSNYIFLFGGHLRTLRNRNVYHFVVLAAIMLPLVLYLVFESSWLWHNVSPAVVILFLYCWLMLLINFVKAATLDPGILPKNVHLTDGTQFLPQEYYNVITLPSSNGISKDVEIKYCSSCRIWRLPRASHCSTCNCCIQHHDHHCRWLNNCVGQRNFGFFLNFLQFVMVTCIFLIVTSFVHLHNVPHVSSSPMSLFLIVYSFLLMPYPMLLVLYQYFLTTNSITTREYLHVVAGVESKNIFSAVWNSRFNEKNVLRNWVTQCFRSRGVSNVRVLDRTNDDIRLRRLDVGGRY